MAILKKLIKKRTKKSSLVKQQLLLELVACSKKGLKNRKGAKENDAYLASEGGDKSDMRKLRSL